MNTARAKTTPESTAGSFAPQTREAPEVSLATGRAAEAMLARESALGAFHHSQEAYRAANARYISAAVREHYPDAAAIRLEESDQEGCTWNFVAPLDRLGEPMMQGEDDNWDLVDAVSTECTDLPESSGYLTPDGKGYAILDLDKALALGDPAPSAEDVAEAAWGEDWRERLEAADITPEGLLGALALARTGVNR